MSDTIQAARQRARFLLGDLPSYRGGAFTVLDVARDVLVLAAERDSAREQAEQLREALREIRDRGRCDDPWRACNDAAAALGPDDFAALAASGANEESA